MSIPATSKQFIDLEIRIFPVDASGAGYPVEITLGGQQEFPRGSLSVDILPWVHSGDPAADGQRLLEALLADGALRDAWNKACGQAPQRRIRLRIDPRAAELHALPWELLRDGSTMLSAQADTPFSRYLPIALPWGGPVEERPIRVLVVVSNPADLEDKYDLVSLDVDVERSILKVALSGLDEDVQLDFLSPPVTLKRIEQALQRGSRTSAPGYHILHYVGHGVFSEKRQQAALYLQDDEGNTAIVRSCPFLTSHFSDIIALQ